MKEVIRVRCPVCGMMTDLEQMAKAEADKPTEIRLFLQKFGGKVSTEKLEAQEYQKKGRGKAPGYMEYTDITDEYPDQVSHLANFFLNRAKLFLSSLKK